MNTIKGTNLVTINAEVGETYCIEYESSFSVNILNQTDSIISVSTQTDYAEDGVSSECLKLVEDAFYYNFRSRLSDHLYITSEGDGYIALVRTDR